MKTSKTLLIGFAVLTVVSGCSRIPSDAYKTRTAESLLTASTQSVEIDLSSNSAPMQMTNWINKQEPSSAILSCATQAACIRAKEVLAQFGISYEERGGLKDQVTLVYDNIVARDCDNRFITNHINPYNMNHPSFGCAMAVNTVQMVGDKRQFTDPMLLGPYDGQKATQNYDDYLSRGNLRDSSNVDTVGTDRDPEERTSN